MFEKFFSKKENNETNPEIKKIHFLIHPGYILESKLARNNYLGLETLLEDYFKKAKSLKKDELMVIFAPRIGTDFIRDFTKKSENNEIPKKYVETIRDIVKSLEDNDQKGVMGNRAIVLADTDQFINKGARFTQNREEIWDKILSITHKRGFTFSKEVEAEAYGEYKSLCVTEIARNMRFAQNSPIAGPVEINDKLTEEGHRYPAWMLRKNPEN